jgi:hypothetical protein
MRTTMTGGEETPAIVLSGAVGQLKWPSIPSTRRSCAVTRLQSSTGSTASHIHIGPKGVSGPVVIDFPIGTGRTGDFT